MDSKAQKVRKEFLLYLETWSDSSLENLILVYKGEGRDVDLSKYPDEKIKKFMGFVERLRGSRRHDDLQDIYEIIDSLCQTI